MPLMGDMKMWVLQLIPAISVTARHNIGQVILSITTTLVIPKDILSMYLSFPEYHLILRK